MKKFKHSGNFLTGGNQVCDLKATDNCRHRSEPQRGKAGRFGKLRQE